MQRNKISFKGQKIFVGIDVHAKNWEVANNISSIQQPYHPKRQFLANGEFHRVCKNV